MTSLNNWAQHLRTIASTIAKGGRLVAALIALGACNPGLAGMVLMPGLFNPCNYDGTLSFHLSEIGSPNWGGTSLWLDRTDSRGYRGGRVPGGTIEVGFVDDTPETDMKFAGTPLEVYRGSVRIKVPSKHESPGRVDGSCGYAQAESFDLRALKPGSYTLVHRRSSGVNGEVYCGKEECKWTTFDGEAALTTKLVIPGPNDLPTLRLEEVHENIRFRIDRIRACYQPLVEKMSGTPEDEDVVLDIRILPDRAYGIAALPEKIDATAPVARCIKEALGYMRFDAPPVTPLIVRYRIVASMVPESFKIVELNATFVEMVEDVDEQQK